MILQYLGYYRPPSRELPVTVFKLGPCLLSVLLIVCNLDLVNHSYRCFFRCLVGSLVSLLKSSLGLWLGLSFLSLALAWIARVPVSHPRKRFKGLSLSP